MIRLGGLLAAVAAAVAVHGYLANAPVAFHAGLRLLVGGLAGLSLGCARRGRSAAVLTLNTLIGLTLAPAGFELLHGVRGAPESDGEPAVAHGFEAARGSPERFARWWKRYVEEWLHTRADTMMDDPRGVNPFVPRPGARGRFLDSEIRINALGFRGPEILRDKGDRFRIVALGESTTFGATIRRGDRPWPELLEEKLNRELGCGATVEVVNAGIPGWTLANNNARLAHDILPLEPDVILSYHGYNGFPYLTHQLPSMTVAHPPRTPERPSELLRRVEERLRLWWFRRRFRVARAADVPIPASELQATRYAAEYRSLAVFARHHGIRLVLSNFNMAVNEASPEPVIRFYEAAFPDVRIRLLTNRLHTHLVREMGAIHEVPVIDTSAGIDGNHEEAFIDIMHFTQRGRERFVENLYSGIRDILVREPRLRCGVAAG